jgi:hypothetical protein
VLEAVNTNNMNYTRLEYFLSRVLAYRISGLSDYSTNSDILLPSNESVSSALLKKIGSTRNKLLLII